MTTANGAGGKVWKVGQWAASTGLTVRALHHYDQLGPVRPSARTPSGYRLHQQAELVRPYQVWALRQLGLPLHIIGELLNGALPIGELLDRHRCYLDRQKAAIRILRAQLTSVADASRQNNELSVTDCVELIRKVVTVDGTIKQYFNQEHLADLPVPHAAG